jgi:hypothetical protein
MRRPVPEKERRDPMKHLQGSECEAETEREIRCSAVGLISASVYNKPSFIVTHLVLRDFRFVLLLHYWRFVGNFPFESMGQRPRHHCHLAPTDPLKTSA